MATFDDRSISRKEKLLAPFSVKRFTAKAQAIAETLQEKFRDIEHIDTDTCYPILMYFSEIAQVPFERTLDMLKTVMPAKASPFFYFRLAVMVMEYLPLFEKDNVRMERDYDGSVPLWAHCRILESAVKTSGRERVEAVSLILTSALAGRLTTFQLDMRSAYALLRKVGFHRAVSKYDPAVPQELTGAYIYVKFGNRDNMVNVPLVFDATSSEKSANRMLTKLRLNHSCGRNGEAGCTTCPVGRDKCALACRLNSKAQDEDNRKTECGPGE